MKIRAIALLLAFVAPVFAQHLVPQKTFDAIAGEYSGEAAQESDRQIVEYHRIQGSPMMAAVAEKVVLAKLRAWGIESKLEQFPSDGKITYQKTYPSPMGWEMRGGELWVESVAGETSFTPIRFCRYNDVPMCVSTYSKGGEWSGELVDVGAGTKDKDYEGKDVRGKVALAYGYAANVVRAAAIRRGAIGVVIYPPPGDRADHPDMVRYNGVWPTADELDKTVGGFQISQNQYTQLQEWMRKGAVRVRGKIDATLGPGQLTLVHAWIRGTKTPQTEVLLTAHLDHPKWSANDNASGSAAMLEMARTLHSLIASGKLPAPAMTIHFMWVPEHEGTIAYLTKHPEVRSCNSSWLGDPRNSEPYRPGDPCVNLNLNLDMVGEDAVKTNSRFYITRTPDSVRGFLNGFMVDVLEQTREADLYALAGSRNLWHATTMGYAQGSDHDLFLGLGIPAVMLGHEPDWTHHTSEDTPDKTDATEFRRVGVLTAAAAYWMSAAQFQDLERLGAIGTGDIIADYAKRIAVISAGPSSEGAKRRLQSALHVMTLMTPQQQNYANGILEQIDKTYISPVSPLPPSLTRTPRRLSLIPFNGQISLAELLPADDKKWWTEQGERFASQSPGGGFPLRPPFEQVVFEAVNFMDGKRASDQIANLLASEFNTDIDQAWMDRLDGILERLDLITTKGK